MTDSFLLIPQKICLKSVLKESLGIYLLRGPSDEIISGDNVEDLKEINWRILNVTSSPLICKGQPEMHLQ